MGVRDVLPILTDGGSDPVTGPDEHIECRDCGTNLTPDAGECPNCGGEVVVYDLS